MQKQACGLCLDLYYQMTFDINKFSDTSIAIFI